MNIDTADSTDHLAPTYTQISRASERPIRKDWKIYKMFSFSLLLIPIASYMRKMHDIPQIIRDFSLKIIHVHLRKAFSKARNI